MFRCYDVTYIHTCNIQAGTVVQCCRRNFVMDLFAKCCQSHVFLDSRETVAMLVTCLGKSLCFLFDCPFIDNNILKGELLLNPVVSLCN